MGHDKLRLALSLVSFVEYRAVSLAWCNPSQATPKILGSACTTGHDFTIRTFQRAVYDDQTTLVVLWAQSFFLSASWNGLSTRELANDRTSTCHSACHREKAFCIDARLPCK